MRELARRTDMQHTNISKVLSGKQTPAFDFYVKVAQAFDAVPEMLQVAGILSSADEVDITMGELWRAIRSLTDEEQQHLSAYVDFLIEQRKRGTSTSTDSQPEISGG